MADFKDTLSNLTNATQPHHTELVNLSAQIEKLEQQRALLKVSAAAEIHVQAQGLGIPKEAIAQLVAACL